MPQPHAPWHVACARCDAARFGGPHFGPFSSFVIQLRRSSCEGRDKNEATASACFTFGCRQYGSAFVTISEQCCSQRIVRLVEVSPSHSSWCVEVACKDAVERQPICTMVATYFHKLNKMEGTRKTTKAIGSHRNAAARKRLQSYTATSDQAIRSPAITRGSEAVREETQCYTRGSNGYQTSRRNFGGRIARTARSQD